jgi:hypothetical protein
MRTFFIALSIAMPSVAHAQTFTCDVLQHWRNAAINGQYQSDNPEVRNPDLKVVLNFQTGSVKMGNMQPINGQTVHVAGANSIGILTGGTRELTVHAVFPNIRDPKGQALGSIMRLNDNDYMPKGTMMTRLSCKRS